MQTKYLCILLSYDQDRTYDQNMKQNRTYDQDMKQDRICIQND